MFNRRTYKCLVQQLKFINEELHGKIFVFEGKIVRKKRKIDVENCYSDRIL